MKSMKNLGLIHRTQQLINSRHPRYKYREIAKYIGVSTQAVSLWVRTGIMSDLHLEKLAKFFQVKPSWLKYGDTAPPEKIEITKEVFADILERIQNLEKLTVKLGAK